jgi:hypothetical protein
MSSNRGVTDVNIRVGILSRKASMNPCQMSDSAKGGTYNPGDFSSTLTAIDVATGVERSGSLVRRS